MGRLRQIMVKLIRFHDRLSILNTCNSVEGLDNNINIFPFLCKGCEMTYSLGQVDFGGRIKHAPKGDEGAVKI